MIQMLYNFRNTYNLEAVGGQWKNQKKERKSIILKKEAGSYETNYLVGKQQKREMKKKKIFKKLIKEIKINRKNDLKKER